MNILIFVLVVCLVIVLGILMYKYLQGDFVKKGE